MKDPINIEYIKIDVKNLLMIYKSALTYTGAPKKLENNVLGIQLKKKN